MNTRGRYEVEAVLSEKTGNPVTVMDMSSVGGGCINETAKVSTNIGFFFAKWNDAKRFPNMLEAEAKGLQLLRNANAVKVPEVIGHKVMGDAQYLVLEFIEGNRGKGSFWNRFGNELAALHRHTSEKCGLDHDNYIGSLPQSNRLRALWIEFFILERLEPQLKLARDEGRIGNSVSRGFAALFSKLEHIFPLEKPSLLHGDLWNGNYMTGSKGEPVLIDPAVYFGHREMDIGMTKLFGGFPAEFYRSYHESFPLEKGWQERVDICNLYPLMVHVNLFGGGYADQVEGILRRF